MKRIFVLVLVALVVCCCGLCLSGCSKDKGDSDKIYNSVDQMPRQINNVEVRYPKDALENKIEGVVHVKMLLNADGRVKDAQVSVSSGTMSLDLAAVEAAKKCAFTPGLIDGMPVRIVHGAHPHVEKR